MGSPCAFPLPHRPFLVPSAHLASALNSPLRRLSPRVLGSNSSAQLSPGSPVNPRNLAIPLCAKRLLGLGSSPPPPPCFPSAPLVSPYPLEILLPLPVQASGASLGSCFSSDSSTHTSLTIWHWDPPNVGNSQTQIDSTEHSSKLQTQGAASSVSSRHLQLHTTNRNLPLPLVFPCSVPGPAAHPP